MISPIVGQSSGGSGGSGILSGQGAPSASLGSDGDFYYDTASPTLYGPKALGQWPPPVPLGGSTVVNRTDSTDPYTVTQAGAQSIPLPVNNPANIEMYLNGVLQPETMFSVSGALATVSAALGAVPGDKIEFEYEIVSYSSTASNEPVDEVPTGIVNGVNTKFTLGYLPIANTLNLYINGIRCDNGDYSIVGQTITFILAPTKKITATYYR